MSSLDQLVAAQMLADERLLRGGTRPVRAAAATMGPPAAVAGTTPVSYEDSSDDAQLEAFLARIQVLEGLWDDGNKAVRF
jgi:hypothetical protein